MDQLITIDGRANYSQWNAECAEVASGRRGFVAVTKKQAEDMGLQMGSLKMCAERHGLKLKIHGKYGHTWSK